MGKTIRAADLFAGAGGSSTGLLQACEASGRRLDLLAVNHWTIAVETHAANHPNAKHLCKAIDSIDPHRDVPGGKLDVLIASPPCTHHSTARGGKPMCDQSRSTAWEVVRWAEICEPRVILCENVREWQQWGPLGLNGRPMKRRRGETFQAWLGALRSLGYSVSHRVLNAADYGGATTRERLFVVAVRGRKPFAWPEPTHARRPEAGLFGELLPWRAAREIIDWTHKGKSIFGRKKPLAENTMNRIIAGLRKFGGEAFVQYMGHAGAANGFRGRETADPMPTVTGKGQFALVKPFLLNLKGTGKDQIPSTARNPEEPLQAVTADGNNHGVCEPFVVTMREGAERLRRSAREPLPTITAGIRTLGIAEPFLVPNFGEREGQTPRTHSTSAPLPTVTGHGAGALCEPFVMQMSQTGSNGHRCRTTHAPLVTVTTADDLAVVRPFFVQAGGPTGKARQPGDVEEPLSTVMTDNRTSLVEPFLVKYYGTADGACATSDPLDTVTARDRFALVVTLSDGTRALLDILFRMLTPKELASAMGFPADYVFRGKRDDVVRQIGNAVSVENARALCAAALELVA